MKNSILQFRQAATAALAASLSMRAALCHAGWMQCGAKYLPPTDDGASGLQGVSTQFKEADGWTVAQPQDAALRGKWWEIYNEPELNALEDQLNIDNQNIRRLSRTLWRRAPGA
jgi:hypothetical protein